jgi:hypothetical protein
MDKPPHDLVGNTPKTPHKVVENAQTSLLAFSGQAKLRSGLDRRLGFYAVWL